MDRIKTGNKSLLSLTAEQRIELGEISGYMTAKQVAAHFGISYNTLLNMFKREPEVQHIFDKGRANVCRDVASALYKKAMSGDVNAQKFYLERMGGWQETTIVQQETKKVKKFSDMYDDNDDEDGGEEE